MELMRGKYELRDDAGIQTLIDQTTLAERESLLTRSFPDLWRELWNGPASRRYHAEYEQARAKFEVLRSALSTAGRRNLASYCETSTTAWTEPEWGFPKGRRSSSEGEVACAIRETQEEAGVRPADMRILELRDVPLLEEFRGSNGISYRHRYWIAEVNPEVTVRLDPGNPDQCREIGDVRWCSMEEALALIRPYNVAKRAVLQRAAALVAVM